MKPRFLVVGTVRNVAKTIFREVKNLNREFSKIGEFEYFLVESDSTDSTLQELVRTRSIHPEFDFISMGDLSNKEPDRISRLIVARNRYVEEIRNRSLRKKYDFVVVADFDKVNTDVKYKCLIKSIKLLNTYDAICANQKRRYYDLLALRHKYWCPENIFVTFEWYRTILPHTKARQAAIFSRMITIDSKLPPLEVDSAFGGLAIYKLEVFTRFDYTFDRYAQPGDLSLIHI